MPAGIQQQNSGPAAPYWDGGNAVDSAGGVFGGQTDYAHGAFRGLYPSSVMSSAAPAFRTNTYLGMLLDPFRPWQSDDIYIPDGDITPSIGKRVAVSGTVLQIEYPGNSGSSPDGLFVYMPASKGPLLELFFYGVHPIFGGTRPVWMDHIDPSYDVVTRFKWSRPVAGGIAIESSSITGNNFEVGGKFNAVFTTDLPPLYDVTYQNLPGYSDNSLESCPSYEGVVALMPPCDPRYHSRQTNAVQYVDGPLYYLATVPQETSSKVVPSVIYDSLLDPDFPPNLWRDVETEVVVSTDAQGAAAAARLFWVLEISWAQWAFSGGWVPAIQTESVTVYSTHALASDISTTVLRLRSYGHPVERIRLTCSNNLGVNLNTITIQQFRLSVKVPDYSAFGQNGPAHLIGFSGLAIGQELAISGAALYQLIPNSALNADVTATMPLITDPMMADEARVVYAGLAQLGITSLFRRSAYTSFVAAGGPAMSIAANAVPMAAGIWSKAGKTMRTAISEAVKSSPAVFTALRQALSKYPGGFSGLASQIAFPLLGFAEGEFIPKAAGGFLDAGTPTPPAAAAASRLAALAATPTSRTNPSPRSESRLLCPFVRKGKCSTCEFLLNLQATMPIPDVDAVDLLSWIHARMSSGKLSSGFVHAGWVMAAEGGSKSLFDGYEEGWRASSASSDAPPVVRTAGSARLGGGVPRAAGEFQGALDLGEAAFPEVGVAMDVQMGVEDAEVSWAAFEGFAPKYRRKQFDGHYNVFPAVNRDNQVTKQVVVAGSRAYCARFVLLQKSHSFRVKGETFTLYFDFNPEEYAETDQAIGGNSYKLPILIAYFVTALSARYTIPYQHIAFGGGPFGGASWFGAFVATITGLVGGVAISAVGDMAYLTQGKFAAPDNLELKMRANFVPFFAPIPDVLIPDTVTVSTFPDGKSQFVLVESLAGLQNAVIASNSILASMRAQSIEQVPIPTEALDEAARTATEAEGVDISRYRELSGAGKTVPATLYNRVLTLVNRLPGQSLRMVPVSGATVLEPTQAATRDMLDHLSVVDPAKLGAERSSFLSFFATAKASEADGKVGQAAQQARQAWAVVLQRAGAGASLRRSLLSEAYSGDRSRLDLYLKNFYKGAGGGGVPAGTLRPQPAPAPAARAAAAPKGGAAAAAAAESQEGDEVDYNSFNADQWT